MKLRLLLILFFVTGAIHWLCSQSIDSELSSSSSIALNINGGIGDVTANWLDGYSGATNSSLPSREYNYEVSDEASSALKGSVIINPVSSISLVNIMQVNTNCIENAIGSFSATVQGGNSPYSIEIEQLTESFNEVFIPTSNTVSGVLGDFSFANLSAGEYNLIITDANGFESDFQFEIASLDTDPPFFECPNDQIENTGSTCTFSLPDYFVGIGVADDCAVVTTQSPSPSTHLAVGVHNIYLRAADAAGNDYSCNFQLTVLDVQNPLIVAPVQPLTFEVNQNCEATVPDYTTILTTTDNCGISSFSQAPIPGTILDSDFTLILSVSDVNGNDSMMSLNVELVDSSSPTYTESVPSEFSTGGDCYYQLEDLTTFVSGFDNCSAVSISQDPAVGTELGVGTHSIDFSIQDANGNHVDFSKAIIVQDQESPTGTVDAPFIFEINDGCQWVVEDLTVNVIANDNCGVELITQIPAVGEVLDIGISMIEFEVIDEAGNVLTLQQEISIRDLSAPTLLLNSAPNSAVANENCEWIVSDLTGFVEGIDNCSDVTVVQIPLPGTVLEIGEHTIEFYLFDASTNSFQVDHNIEVKYNLPPDLIVSTPVEFSVGDECLYELGDLLSTVSTNQNCSSHSVVQAPSPGELLGLGSHVITFTVTDEFDNSLTVDHAIEVVDTQAPVVVCPSDVLEVAMNYDCSFQTPSWEDELSIDDNCTSYIYVINVEDFGGQLYNYTLEISDGTNSSFCTVTVQGLDVTPPLISAWPADQAPDFDEQCQYALLDYSSSLEVTDSCTPFENLVITQDPPAGALITGETQVTILVVDNASLSSTCSFIVSPTDQSAPTIISCAEDQVISAVDCTVEIPDYTSELVAEDNCIYTIEQLPAPGTTLTIGDHPVIFKVSDGVNDEVTCEMTVSVVDDLSPIVTDISLDQYPSNTDCQHQLEGWESYIQISDCSDFQVSMAPQEGEFFNSGDQEVVFTVSDGINSPTNLAIQLYISEDFSWTLIGCPSNSELILDSSCQAVLPDFTSLIETSATCGTVLEIIQTPTPGTIIEGEQEIQVQIAISGNDGEEENCTFTVIVEDETIPELNCEDFSLSLATCVAIMPNISEFNWAEDLCTEVSYSQSIAQGTELGVGQHLLSIQASGGGDTPATCEVTVTVEGNTAPIIDCSSNETLQVSSDCTYEVEDFRNLISVEDNCLELINIEQRFAGESESNISQLVSPGEYTIEFIVTDDLHSLSCSRTLVVESNSIPTLTCAENISVALVDGENCSQVIEYDLPEVLNSCGAEELIQTAGLSSGAAFPIGVTVNSFDLLLNGQTVASCSFEVELIDEVLPSIVCPESIVSCDPVVFYDLPQAFDNCDGVTIEQMSQLEFSSGSIFPLGTTSIAFKAVDAQGNWVTCDLVIEIIASAPPVWESLDATYCVDQVSINLNEMVDFSGTVSWSENTPNGLLDLSELGAGIHEITLMTEQNSCNSELSQTIEILALPTVDIIAQEEVCGMQLNLEVAGSASSYNWAIPDGVISASSSSDQIQDVLANDQGSYIFQVTGDLNGCQASTDISIQFWDQPGIPDAGLNQQINGSATTLIGTYDGIGEIYWESLSEEVIIQEPNQIITDVLNISAGWNDFFLYQTNGNCLANSDMVRINVLEFEIPTGFSPNGDNVNDVFYVNGLEKYANAQLRVFNRWGNEVYKNNKYKNEWDGTNNNGNLLEEDTYYLVLTLDDEEYRGYVVIKK